MIPELPRHQLFRYPLEFYEGRTANGLPVKLCRRGTMPRIDDKFLDCVIYLYPTVADAREGRRAGGAGFWVGVQSESPPAFWHPYIVTNGHVVNKRRGKSGVLRINNIQGGFEIVETDLDSWIHHPDGDDVAVYPISGNFLFKMKFIPRDLFITRERIKELDIGPGNDVVMVSRLISHGGIMSNTPALRFGNIAMMPIEPIENQDGLKQESFLVEGRSLPGTSGSPVFVQFSIHDHSTPDGPKLFEKAPGPWLLGVNWGHLRLVEPEFEFIVDYAGERHPDGWKVQVNTGIMQVVPAWKISEVLDLPELQEKRLSASLAKLQQLQEVVAMYDTAGMPKEIQRRLLGIDEDTQRAIEKEKIQG